MPGGQYVWLAELITLNLSSSGIFQPRPLEMILITAVNFLSGGLPQKSFASLNGEVFAGYLKGGVE
jgi:hypothetical protein